MNCEEDKDPGKISDCQCCEKGQFVHAACDGSKQTECKTCPLGSYMDKKSFMFTCLTCKVCDSKSHLKKLTECLADRNTHCECETGFYCNDSNCEHCLPVTLCPLGQGVVRLATSRNDTVCSPCLDETYSNVTDPSSPCQKHTRCENIHRELKSPGTQDKDTECGPLMQTCHWILPASLWAGLFLTSLIIIVIFIFWKSKRQRQSHRSVSISGIPEDQPPTPAFNQTALPFFVECDAKCNAKSVEQIHSIQSVHCCVHECEVQTDGAALTTQTRATQLEPKEDEWNGT